MAAVSCNRKFEDRSAGNKILELKKAEYVRPHQSGGQKSKIAAHDQVVIVKTNGYTLSRSPSKVKMSIQTAAFFGDVESKAKVERPLGSAVSAGCSTPSLNTQGSDRINTSKASIRSGNSSRDRQLAEALEMYENLQLEMAALEQNMKVEKEELQAQIAMLEEKLEEERSVFTAKHEEALKEINHQHSSFISEIEKKNTLEVRSVSDSLNQEKAKLERQIEFMEKSLSKLKEDTKREREENTKMHSEVIRVMKEDHRKSLEVMEEKIRTTSFTEMIMLQEKLTDHHKREMENLKEEHKKEIDVLMHQLSRIEQLEEEAAKNSRIIKKLEKKNSRYKQEIKISEAKLITVQAQLLETETALENFKKGFERKVKDVEDKLRDRLDNLLLENSQLRKKLLTKTEEFCQYRVNVERGNDRTLQSFKERVQVLLSARTKAKLGVVLGISEDSLLAPPDSELCPNSAPSTEKESDIIRHSLLASEESLKQQLERPNTSLPIGSP